MIKKIEKIKNLGIFYDYKDDPKLSEFSRYNLVYGWNGGGKTTLSNLLAMLETGSSLEYPDVEYRINSDEGKTKQTEQYPRTVRVFNRNFVRDNAPSLEDPSSTTNHIFILGKKDKELAKKNEQDKKDKTKLEDLLNRDDKAEGRTSLSTRKKQLDKSWTELFKEIAKTIASSRGRAFRDYDRRDAIKVYKSLEKKQELNKTELEQAHLVIEQKIQDKLEKITLQKSGEDSISDELNDIVTASNKLLAGTVQQKAIARLTENPDIAEWVAQGVLVHTEHKSSKCEYCSQTIPPARNKELAEHFNAAHKALMDSIEIELGRLRTVYAKIQAVVPVDKTNLYEHLRENYDQNKQAFEKAKTNVLDDLTKLGELLNDKKVKSHEAMKPVADFDLGALTASVGDINRAVEDHNKISNDFEATTEKAKDQLEKHYVSTIFDKAKKLEKEIEDNEAQISDTEKQIQDLTGIIRTNEAKIRSTKVACDKLNKMLKEFLGRGEICFEDDENGYLIKRDGKLASHLSEGEKTAIALVYFIICLESDDVDIKETIIVVDDPISSLDMDAVYRVCALIKIKMKPAHQLILLTHNYEFFNQIKDWFNVDPEIAAKDTDSAKVQGHYFMIKNPFDTVLSKRVARLAELDLLLRNYKSEYHYLFKKLSNYKEDIVKTGESTIEAVYPYPNIARKTLECFLSFRVPESGSFYVRLKKLRSFSKDITEEEIDDVYNFANSHSHLDTKTGLMQFDPTLEKNGEKYIEMTLDLIRKSDEKHYGDMIKLI